MGFSLSSVKNVCIDPLAHLFWAGISEAFDVAISIPV